VTCDETFELLLEEYDAGAERTKAESGLAAERAAVVCNETFELSFEGYDAGAETSSDTAVTSHETFEVCFEEYDPGRGACNAVPEDAADGSSVTCDETFELLLEEYDARAERTKAESGLAAERAVVVCNETLERSCEEYDAGAETPSDTAVTTHETFEVCFEDYDPGRGGCKPVPEDAADGGSVTCDETFELLLEEYDAGAEGTKAENADVQAASKNTVHVPQPSKENTVAAFNERKSIDLNTLVLPKDEKEITVLSGLRQSESSSADHCLTFDTRVTPSESANVGNCLCTLSEVVVSSFASVDTKLQLESMGRFACSVADILFDDISVESFQSLVDSAALIEDKKFRSMSKDSNWNEIGSGGINDTIKNEKVTTIDNNPDLLWGTATFKEASMNHGRPKAERKSGLWKRLTKRRKGAKNRSGDTSLKKLSNEAMLASEMLLAEKDVKSEIGETSSTFNAVAEPLRQTETQTGTSFRNRSMTFFYSPILRKLEMLISPEEEDQSYQSYQSESTLSKVEEGGIIADVFTDNDNMPLHHVSLPICAERQESTRSDITGASSTADVFQIINEAETAIPEDSIQVSNSTSGIKPELVWEVILNPGTNSVDILDANSLWKDFVEADANCSYYNDNCNHETTWTVTPSFINA
jgi:hypothetical protein